MMPAPNFFKIMVTVVNYLQKENSEGKKFFTLIVQGEPEMVISQKGKPYLTAHKASMVTTFDEPMCKHLIGRQLPGTIQEVECDPYEMTTDDGKVIIRDRRMEYSFEEPTPQPEEVKPDMLQDAFTL